MEQFEDILKQIASKKSMEKVIEYLKSLNFEFADVPTLQTYIGGDPFTPKWTRKYSYLVRRYIPMGGKRSLLDTRLMIGVHFVGIRLPKYLIFQDHRLITSILKPWDKPHEFNTKKKKVLLKFPDSLDIEERKVWRKYHEWFKKEKTMTKEQMDWYLKFKPLIQNLDKEFDHLS